jgi:hypothetical protein
MLMPINTFGVAAGDFAYFRVVSRRQFRCFPSSSPFLGLVRFPAAPLRSSWSRPKALASFLFHQRLINIGARGRGMFATSVPHPLNDVRTPRPGPASTKSVDLCTNHEYETGGTTPSRGFSDGALFSQLVVPFRLTVQPFSSVLGPVGSSSPWRVGRRRRVVAGNRHSTETVGAGSVWRGSAQELRLQNQVFK